MDRKYVSWTLMLVFVGLLAYIVFAEVNSSNPTLVTPTARQNISGNFVINVSAPGLSGVNNLSNYTNVTVWFFNASSNLAITRFNLTDRNPSLNVSFNLTLNSATFLVDGLYNITINATNQTDGLIVNNISVFDVNNLIRIDNTAPSVVSVNLPGDRFNFTNGTHNFTMVFNVTNASGSDIMMVIFQLTNGSNPTFNVTAVFNQTLANATINISAMADGNQTVTVFANDTAGNMNNSVTSTFIVDTVPPQNLTLLLPIIQYNSSSATVVFNWTVGDNLATSSTCNLTIDAVVNQSNVVIANNSFANISVLRISEELHSWNVTCWDNVFNSNTSATRFFRVDLNTTDVTATNGTLSRANFTTGKGNVVFNVSVNNLTGSAVHKVIFQLTNGSNSPFNVTASNGTNMTVYNATVNVSAMADGNQTVTVFANDTAGNMNNSFTINFLIDTVAPIINIVNGTTFNTTNSTPMFTFNFSDVDDLINCTVFNSSNNVKLDTNISADGSTYNGTNTNVKLTTALGDGTTQLFVNCTDDVRLVGQSAGLNITIDTVAPDVQTINLPIDRQNSSSGTLIFNVSISNNSGTAIQRVIFIVQNNTNYFNLTASATNATLFNASIAVTSLAEGVRNVTIFTNDTVGNVNRTTSQFFTIDYTTTDVTTTNGSSSRVNFTTANRNVVFNVSVNNLTGSAVHTVIFQLNNGSNPLFNVTASIGVNSTVYNTTINVSAMAEGNTTMTVFANDTAGNMNNSFVMYFVIDRTAPVVTYTNGSFTTANTTPSVFFDVRDSADILNCSVYNYTNNVSITTNNDSLTYNGTTKQIKIANGLHEGATQLFVNCTDSVRLASNTGQSASFNVTIDTTKPVTSVATASDLTSTSAKLTVSTSETTTCKYGNGDNNYVDLASFMDGSGADHTATVTGLSADTSYTYYVRCIDGMLNTQTSSSTITFKTSGATSGGGGGGSGGGSGSSVSGQFSQQTWTSINTGETATLRVGNGGVGIIDVSFQVAKTTYGATIKVEKVDTLPATVSAYTGKVYKNIKIYEANLEKNIKGTATINFKVEKTWLDQNKLDKSSVSMLRWKDSQWNELPTTVGEDDGKYIHYTSQTPGFSYFVIGQRSGAVAAQPASTAPPSLGATAPSSSEPSTGEAVAETADKSPPAPVWPWVGLIIIIALIVGVVYWLSQRR